MFKKRKEKLNLDESGDCVKKCLWNSKNFDIMRTRLQLAAGLSTNRIASIGEKKTISMETLVRICKALNCGILDGVALEPDGTNL